VGRRVVLRHLLPDGRATDVLGELLAWDDPGGYARVATKTGEVAVPLGDILMGRPVPPAPPPRPSRRPGRPSPPSRPAERRPLSVTELHDVMADGWQSLERADYGGWRLRAAEGFTGRSNSVLPLGPPPAPLADAVDHAERWYAERSLPGRFCVPWALGHGPGDPAYGDDPLEAELVRRDYTLDTPTFVLTAPLDREPPAADEHPWRIELSAEPDEGFLALYRYRGQDLPPIAKRILTSAPSQTFVSIRRADTARTVAVGRAASARGWTGISAVEVASDHRRQGLGHLVMTTLHDWGRDHGDHSAYLQVARSNTAARALYAELGYTAHSGYHYRIQT
jgi:N-acetylglutamate synthase